ncbi:hypothetical protein C8K15_11622 [Paenisporosarcina sp. OV554]|nr:hypothetical protein C8K15_11622 [Paenisporosarcina sp. OV554]
MGTRVSYPVEVKEEAVRNVAPARSFTLKS